MNIVSLEKSDVPATLRRGYMGRKFAANVHDDGTVHLSGAYWDGGSRSSYSLVNISTGERRDPNPAIKNPPQFGGPRETPTVEIPAGWAVVEHSIFCGKDMGLTFHMLAADVAPMLPAPAPELPREQAIVLIVSAGLKAFARREYAARAKPAVKAEAYDAALVALQSLGYLRANKSITPKGRNVARTLNARDYGLCV